MSKFSKILLGILSIWPLAWIMIFFLMMLKMMTSFNQPGNEPDPGNFFLTLMLPHFMTMLVFLGLQALYVFTLLKDDRLDTGQKTLWALFVFIGNMIAFPFFWYVFFWKEDPFIFFGKKPIDKK